MARRRKPVLQDAYDLVIVGAGPAGCAAALHARRTDASVLVIERERLPRPRPCCGWVGPAAVALLEGFGVGADDVGAVAFRGLTLRRWDLRAESVVADDALAGWIVDRAPFDAALADAARQAGADLADGVTCERLLLADDHVELALSLGRVVRGGVLLIADGARSDTAEQAYLPAAGGMPEQTRAIFLSETAERAPGVEVVLGNSRAGLLVTLVSDGRQTRVALTAREPEQALRAHYAEFRQAADATGLLARPLPADPPVGALAAGIALDLDSHVGKRCLLIGEAGGFVSAFSNEGLYPALRSGCLAVDVAGRALAAELPQDVLSEFGAEWRHDLADYLRMPNTDLGLLAPLVFGNDEMARRVARAFLLGAQF